jgi:hypothetical protein
VQELIRLLIVKITAVFRNNPIVFALLLIILTVILIPYIVRPEGIISQQIGCGNSNQIGKSNTTPN